MASWCGYLHMEKETLDEAQVRGGEVFMQKKLHVLIYSVN